MRQTSKRGFTLIELLTVVAIIAILASMTAAVYSRVIEKAKLASLENEFNQIRTEVVNVAAKTSGSGGFPDGYGFLKRNYKSIQVNNDRDLFNLTPYTRTLQIFRTFALYDPFALNGYAPFPSGEFGLLTFSPATDAPTTLFHGDWSGVQLDYGNPAVWTGFETDESPLRLEQRSLVYVPVNTAQAKTLSDYYKSVLADPATSAIDKDNAAYASVWPSGTRVFGGKEYSLEKAFASVPNTPFPPAKCDAFVLLSIGPAGTTGGIIADPPQSFMTDLAAMYPGTTTLNGHTYTNVEMSLYRVLALRAYYLATRDLNDNGLPDFDFRSRTKGTAEDKVFKLPHPDPTKRGSPGPVIYSFVG